MLAEHKEHYESLTNQSLEPASNELEMNNTDSIQLESDTGLVNVDYLENN